MPKYREQVRLPAAEMRLGEDFGRTGLPSTSIGILALNRDAPLATPLDHATRLEVIDRKLDAILHTLGARPDRQRYLSAKDVGQVTGLDARTILNRSNLPEHDRRFIPSLRFGSRRKFFDRRVIERLFALAR